MLCAHGSLAFQWYEGVLTCLETDTLWEVVKRLVLHEVHGLVVVNAKNVLRGVITLSDVLRYMVLMPIFEKDDDEQSKHFLLQLLIWGSFHVWDFYLLLVSL